MTLSTQQEVRVVFGACVLDPGALELRVRGEIAQVSRPALLVLVRLIQARGEPVGHSELLAAGWSDTTVSEASLRQAICELRRALAADPTVRSALQTVRAAGYRFVAPLEVRTPPRRSPQGWQLGAAPLVGRARELAALTDAWQRTLAGNGRALLLSGGPGIGKSRLARELASRTCSEPALVLQVQAPSERGSLPLWPFRQLVARCLAASGPELRSHCEQTAPNALRSLLCSSSWSREPAPLETPERQRFLLFEELAQLFLACAERLPLLLVLDDLHAADELSQAFFVRLAREAATSRMLLLATSRPLEAREQRPLRRLLDAADHDLAPERVTLSNLGRDDLSLLCNALDAPPLPPEAVDRMYALTRGNPLFSIEIARLLATGRAEELLVTGTDDLFELIRRRLARLPRSVQEVISIAAVLGEEFATAELCGATGQASVQVLSAVREGLAAELLVAGAGEGRYRFAHPLLREAAYDALEDEERRGVHARIATWIESRGPGAIAIRIGELAHHYYNAHSESLASRAALYLTTAAERAYDATAFGESAALYERALEMLELACEADSVPALQTRLKLGEALRAAGAPSERLNALYVQVSEQAAAVGERELLARAALGYAGQGPERFTLARSPHAVDPVERELLTRALRLLGPDQPELRALLLSALSFALLYAFDGDARWSYIDEAAAIARASGNAALLARVLSVRVLLAAAPARTQEQRTACDELVRITAQPALRRAHVEALVMRALAHIARGERDLFDADFRRAQRVATDLGCPEAESMASLGTLFRSFWAGRLADVEQQAGELFRATRDPLRARIALAIRLLGVQYVRYGDTQYEQTLDGLVAAAFPRTTILRCIQIANYAQRGERDEAEREFDCIAADDFAALAESPTWLCEMTTLAGAACALDDCDRAEHVYRRLCPFSDQVVLYGWDALPGGPVASALGMLAMTMGELAQAEHWFERALTICAKLGSTLDELLTKAEYVRLLARRGSGDDLRKLRVFVRQLSAFRHTQGMELLRVRALDAERTLAQLTRVPALKTGS